MQLGIFAKTFPGTTPDVVLRQVAAAGYDCAQFNFACCGLPSMPDAVTDADLAGIAAAVARTGVRLAALSGTYNMIHPDPAIRARGRQRLNECLRAAARIGAPLVTLCTGTRDPDDQWRHHPDNASSSAWRDLGHEMAAAIDMAEQHGVALGIEPELANCVSSAEAASRLLRELGAPCLKIVLDPANLFERADAAGQRALVERAVDLLAPHIAMAHAKDRHADGSFATAGKGVIDFDHFVGRLRQAGFDGPLVTHGLAAEEASDVARFLRAQIARPPK